MRLELPGVPESVRVARRLVSNTLRAWDLEHLDEFATLLTSEVVTNAVLHARTDVAVELRLESSRLRILVSDAAVRPPQPRRHDLHAGTGRGLGLLELLASDWGTEQASEPFRKSVWFELPVDPAALPDPPAGAFGRR